MRFVFSEVQFRHEVSHFVQRGVRKPFPEVPNRARLLLDAIRRRGGRIGAPDDHGTGPLAAVHSPEYLAFLESAWRRWRDLPGASDVVIPNVHRTPGMDEYPSHIVGQAGWHMGDTSCPIAEGTWEAARAAATAAAPNPSSGTATTCWSSPSMPTRPSSIPISPAMRRSGARGGASASR